MEIQYIYVFIGSLTAPFIFSCLYSVLYHCVRCDQEKALDEKYLRFDASSPGVITSSAGCGVCGY